MCGLSAVCEFLSCVSLSAVCVVSVLCVRVSVMYVTVSLLYLCPSAVCESLCDVQPQFQ